MIQGRFPYLSSQTWRWVLATAVFLFLTTFSVRYTRTAFDHAHEEASELSGQIQDLKQKRESFHRVTEEELEPLHRFWDRLSDTRERPSSTQDLIEELSQLAEQAGAKQVRVVAASSRGSTPKPSRIQSLEGNVGILLTPKGMRLEMNADLGAMNRTLSFLSERDRPLQLRRVTVEKHGSRLRVSVDLLYFVAEDSA